MLSSEVFSESVIEIERLLRRVSFIIKKRGETSSKILT